MKNKKARLQIIRDLIAHNSVGSQDDLSRLLKAQGVEVTQATLSRDLKTLRITKVANEAGNYIYVVADINSLQDSPRTGSAAASRGVISIDFAGNFAVIKTRNGYASGLAYDIDMAKLTEILGTIAGANTVFAVLREGVTHLQARRSLAKFIPLTEQE